MSKTITNNTYEKGRARALLYKEGDEFVGVCLDLDILVRGKSIKKVWSCLKDMVESYIENALHNKLPDKVLNRPAPKKYWDKYRDFIEHEKKKLESKKPPTTISKYTPPLSVFNQGYADGRMYA